MVPPHRLSKVDQPLARYNRYSQPTLTLLAEELRKKASSLANFPAQNPPAIRQKNPVPPQPS
jgi:hypothetical protein